MDIKICVHGHYLNLKFADNRKLASHDKYTCSDSTMQLPATNPSKHTKMIPYYINTFKFLYIALQTI